VLAILAVASAFPFIVLSAFDSALKIPGRCEFSESVLVGGGVKMNSVAGAIV
jgi:hypothetical protein